MPDEEVEDILVALILDGRIKGTIDQVTGKLELESQYVCCSSHRSAHLIVYLRNQLDKKRYASLTKWTDLIKSMQDTVVSKSAQAGPGAAGASGGAGGMFSMFDSSVRVGGGY